MKKFLGLLSEILFPNICVGCGEILEQDEYLCDYCFEMSKRCLADKLCLKCGLPKNRCACKRAVFCFDGAIAPFYNDGPVRIAMHKFKFRRKEHFAEFFAREMALCIKQCFSDVSFDFVCCVPMSKIGKIKRGYNQSELLSFEISKILGIRHFKDCLQTVGKKKTQHLLSFEDRVKNVRDVFKCNRNINGKTVLLVDDIKTTGATLNECAKQLLIAGASKVYCVTALATNKKEKKS
ncbi:MAG: ComF family protein [Ruminococcaceae bacterium]|nr:ComF family protein [Oscillospiraceae bacterium]